MLWCSMYYIFLSSKQVKHNWSDIVSDPYFPTDGFRSPGKFTRHCRKNTVMAGGAKIVIVDKIKPITPHSTLNRKAWSIWGKLIRRIRFPVK